MKNIKRLNEDIDELIKEFEKLNSIDEKYSFWEKYFNTHYVYWYSAHSIDYRYKNFFIYEDDKNKIENVNLRNIDYLKNNDEYYSKKFESLEDKIKSFEFSVSEGISKKFLVDQELREINDLIYSDERVSGNFNSVKIASKIKEKPYYSKELKISYEDYMAYNQEPNYKLRIYNAVELFSLNHGFITAQYHKYLTGDEVKETKSKRYSHVHQMLMLDYLGVGHQLKDNQTLRAELYRSIINRDIETTRQYFSKLESEKDVKKLEEIKSIFENCGLKKELQMVKDDIDKIYRRKK